MPGHFKAWTLWAAISAAILAGVLRQSWLFGVGIFILLIGFEVGSFTTHLAQENHEGMRQTLVEQIMADNRRLCTAIGVTSMIIGLIVSLLSL